jgi:hypothetical protein
MVDGEESPHAHSQAPPLDDYCHSAAPPARRESHARAMRPPIPFAGGKNGFAGTGPGSDPLAVQPFSDLLRRAAERLCQHGCNRRMFVTAENTRVCPTTSSVPPSNASSTW